MFERLRSMFGKGQNLDSEAYTQVFSEAKETALKEALGPSHDSVLHAIIPYYLGGTLDLYPFPDPKGGTLYVTQEVIAPNPQNGPIPNALGRYELAAYTRKPFRPQQQATTKTQDPHGTNLISRMLNSIARYSTMAVINPGETMEVPGDKEGSDSLHILLDTLITPGRELRILEEKCSLLLCIAIHRSECDFARAKSTKFLLDRLKAAKVYPYSDLDREPVA